MNGKIDEKFWDCLDQDQKNDLVFRCLVEINNKLNFRYKLYLAVALVMGFVGGIIGHIGEPFFVWLGLMK